MQPFLMILVIYSERDFDVRGWPTIPRPWLEDKKAERGVTTYLDSHSVLVRADDGRTTGGFTRYCTLSFYQSFRDVVI